MKIVTGIKAGLSCNPVSTVCNGLNCLQADAQDVQNAVYEVNRQLAQVQDALDRSAQTFGQTYQLTGCTPV